MSHGPATQWGKDHAAAIKFKMGISMFIIYTLVYAGFIFINVAMPKLMKIDIGSLNLAIVYGFGLIVLALVLAVIYNQFCTRSEERMEALMQEKVEEEMGTNMTEKVETNMEDRMKNEKEGDVE